MRSAIIIGRSVRPIEYRCILSSMKSLIWLGIFVGGAVGGGIGSLLDHGNMLGAWSLILGTIGSLGGIWAGWQLGNYF